MSSVCVITSFSSSSSDNQTSDNQIGSLGMEAPRKRARTGPQQRTPSSSSSAITDLPIHILMEILVRLPIKTLMASKCVRKSWLHLIEDPQFSKLHRVRASFVICFQNKYNERIINLYTGNSSFLNFDSKLNTLLEVPNFSSNFSDMSKFTFANSCNGLLCYYTTGYFAHHVALIWNPITSELVTIPPPRSTKGSFIICFRGYALGFCQKSNRFKLLCICLREYKGSDESVLVAEICTIEKGCSWRMVSSCPYSDCHYHYPVLFQGAVHWLVRDYPPKILSFDIEDEEFAIVPVPPHFFNFDRISPKIGVLAGCLFATESTELSFNIWLMKEYGDQDSWTQVASLKCTPSKRWYHGYSIPIIYLDNGEILIILWGCNYLFAYNPVSDSVRLINNSGPAVEVIAFNPSLVSLKDSVMGYDVHVK